MRRAMFFIVLGCVTASSLGSAQAANAGIEWNEKYYNPKPQPDDLILPMPCGGAMTFRPITIESTDWLDDVKVELGGTDENVAYKEDRRPAYIAGTFTDAKDKARRTFYLGKYEVSWLQASSLAGKCLKPSTGKTLPKVDISWFDAVEAGRHYTEWLLKNAPNSVPKEGRLSGYLRLPTEAEWEFSARGGLAVDAAAFRDRVFPMPDGSLAQYAWYQGSGSAGGKLRPIGLLKGNPLGLHDMLGNASEMVFEPFHLNKRGRLHGQVGGFISKGGDIHTSDAQMRSSIRDEHSFFDARSGEANHLSTMGFRLAISAPAVVSSERLTQIQNAWEQLPSPDAAGATADDQRAAIAAVANVAKSVEDKTLRDQLDAARLGFERVSAERNEVRNRAVKALVRTGAIFANKVKTDEVRLSAVEKAKEAADGLRDRIRARLLDAQAAGQADQAARMQTAFDTAGEQIAKISENLDQLRGGRDRSLAYYADIVVSVASDYSVQVVSPQLDALHVEFELKKIKYLIPYADLFVAHISEYRRTGKANVEAWHRALSDL